MKTAKDPPSLSFHLEPIRTSNLRSKLNVIMIQTERLLGMGHCNIPLLDELADECAL